MAIELDNITKKEEEYNINDNIDDNIFVLGQVMISKKPDSPKSLQRIKSLFVVDSFSKEEDILKFHISLVEFNWCYFTYNDSSGYRFLKKLFIYVDNVINDLTAQDTIFELNYNVFTENIQKFKKLYFSLSSY